MIQTALSAYHALEESQQDELQLVIILNVLGIMWLHRGDFQLSESYLQRAHDLRSQHVPKVPELVRNSCNNLGNATASANKFERSLEWQTTAESIPLEGNDDARLSPQAMTDQNLGRALWLLGRTRKHEEARIRYDKSKARLLESSNWALLSLYVISLHP